jgi:hypothetical protein
MGERINPETVERWRRAPWEFVEEALADPEVGRAYKLLPAERAFMERAFVLGDDGRLLYPEQVYASIKKSGKTAFAAILALVVALLYAGRFAEVVCVANSLEQATGRVFEYVRRIVECSPWLRRQAKILTDRVVFPSIPATIRAIPSDYASAAGSNQNLAIFDELWAYGHESEHRLWDELVPVPTRKIAFRLTVTHAGFAGESAVLEGLYKRGLAQPLIGKDLRAGDGLLMFWSHEPVAPWQTAAWLSDMRRTLRPNQYLRMIENRFVTTESSFIDMRWWDDCVMPRLAPAVADKGLAIYVGVDASVKHDSTAIVATAFDRKAQQVRLVFHRVFQPDPERPLDFEQTIEATVLDLRKRFALCQVLYDPYQMASTAQRLAKALVPMEEFPQSPANLTQASQNLYELIKGRNLVVYPDEDMRRAVAQAVAIESPRGWRIAKERQAHRIDVVVALAQSALASVRGQGSFYDIRALADRPGSPIEPETPSPGELHRAELMRRYGQAPGVAPWLSPERLEAEQKVNGS